MDDYERTSGEQFEDDIHQIENSITDGAERAKDISDRIKNSRNKNSQDSSGQNNDLNLKSNNHKTNTDSDGLSDNPNSNKNDGNLSNPDETPDAGSPQGNNSVSESGASTAANTGAEAGTTAGAEAGVEAGVEAGAVAREGASAAGAAGAEAAIEGASAAAAPETAGTSLIVAAVVPFIKYIAITAIVLLLVGSLILNYVLSFPQILWSQMFTANTSTSNMEYWDQANDWEKEEKKNGIKIHNNIYETAESIGKIAQDNIDESKDTNLYDYDFYNDAKKLTAMSTWVEEIYFNYLIETADKDGYVKDDNTVPNTGSEDTKEVENTNDSNWFAKVWGYVKYGYNYVKNKINTTVHLIKVAHYQRKASKAYKTKDVLDKVEKTGVKIFEYDNNNIGKKNKNNKYIAISRPKEIELMNSIFDERFKNEDKEIRDYCYRHYCNYKEYQGAVDRINMILENTDNEADRHYFVERPEEYFYDTLPIPDAVKRYEKLITAGIQRYIKDNPKYKDRFDLKKLVLYFEARATLESGGINDNLMGINPVYLPKGVHGDALREWTVYRAADITLFLLDYAKVDHDFAKVNNVEIAIMAYGFDGTIYIDWINKEYKGKQTQEAINKYSKIHEEKYGALGKVDPSYLKTFEQYFPVHTITWAYPVPSCHDISCGFYGYPEHNGVDFSNGGVLGAPVCASADGTVVRVKMWERSYGHHVFIKHKNGWITQYCHMGKIFVQEGQPVKQGQKIGEVASTGNSTGPHCHFGMMDSNGNYQDPMKYLPKKKN